MPPLIRPDHWLVASTALHTVPFGFAVRSANGAGWTLVQSDLLVSLVHSDAVGSEQGFGVADKPQKVARTAKSLDGACGLYQGDTVPPGNLDSTSRLPAEPTGYGADHPKDLQAAGAVVGSFHLVRNVRRPIRFAVMDTSKGATMGHLEKVAIQHTRHHIQTARGLMPREQRWKIGAQLVTILRNLQTSKQTKPGNAYTVIMRGGTTRTMWVVKKPAGGLRKGDKVRRKDQLEALKAQGATFREIHYSQSTDVHNALKAMAQCMQPLHHPQQYGFVAKRNCIDSAAIHAYARTVYLLDFENAFDQISVHQVAEILHKVFYVNMSDAYFIAELSTHKGHLYQGSPIAPVIFNIRAMWCVERLTRLCDSNGAKITVYADDVTISHQYWEHFSKGLRKTIQRIISECGLKVNPKKCKVRLVSPRKIGSFDITGLAIDYDPDTGLPFVRPLHRRRYHRKAYYLSYLVEQGVIFSNEVNARGEPKLLAPVAEGLANWAYTTGQPQADPQLPLTH